MRGYDHIALEKAAQKKWESLDLYTTDLTDEEKEKYYLLFEFPYPSGDLHIGHWYAFALTDIYARMLRMQGKNVLFPIGFDAFGLPAENAAIKHGVDPKKWTYENMDRMREQIRSMGTSVDWSKEVVTCEPEYYKWTQWLFSKLYEHNLAERRNAAVKWCPKDLTVLANEQVLDGRCERCGTEVEEKNLTQWFLKITEYADRLLKDLDTLPWREDIKDAQRAWIGESEGARIRFSLTDGQEVEVFTTRPDTIFGATYVVLAPEHALVTNLLPTLTNSKDVEAYRAKTSRKSERERSENKEKTGVKLEGVMAVNPATKDEIPVYVADYVLASYGTGAVMAVPAHDDRDFEFAQKHGLRVTRVIDPVTGTKQDTPKEKGKIVAIVEHEGKVLTINWKPELGGRLTVGGTVEPGEDPVETAKREIAEETGYLDLVLVEKADEQVHHEYFAHSKNLACIAHTTLLHFRLSTDARSEPMLEENEKGKFEVEWLPIATALQAVKDPLHGYALARFLTPGAYSGDGLLRNSGQFDGRDNQEAKWEIAEFVGGERVKNYRMRDWLISRQRYWGCPIPVVYDPEGTAHLVPAEHLPWLLPDDVEFAPRTDGRSPLASSKELHDRVTRLFGEGWMPEYDTFDVFMDSSWYFLRYLDPHNEQEFADQKLLKAWMPVDRYSGGAEHTTVHLLYSRFFNKALFDLALAPTPEPYVERFNRGIILASDGQKMSKRFGNVVNPDEMVQKFGADAVRMYLAFIGPYNEPGNYAWNLDGASSMRRFLDRIASLAEKLQEREETPEEARAFAVALQKVSTDVERFKLNTAISALMTLVKTIEASSDVSKLTYANLARLIAPFAPHFAEHAFTLAGGEGSVHARPWPVLDESLLVEDSATVVVQINGKRRGEVVVGLEVTEEEVLRRAVAELPSIAAVNPTTLKRVIYVPGKILNLVL